MRALEAAPGSSRAELAGKVLGENATDAVKSVLAADLHWLTHAGHVIEFHDGRLDLPLVRPEPVEAVALAEVSASSEETVSNPPAPEAPVTSSPPQEQ
ncbi:MAG: hypothetical protein H7Y43_03115 [Akkermansiaceae bacterium]|nr:hypothetical protein [Verrucomicrobiales bacterium]